jgi:hypothetical protein
MTFFCNYFPYLGAIGIDCDMIRLPHCFGIYPNLPDYDGETKKRDYCTTNRPDGLRHLRPLTSHIVEISFLDLRINHCKKHQQKSLAYARHHAQQTIDAEQESRYENQPATPHFQPERKSQPNAVTYRRP